MIKSVQHIKCSCKDCMKRHHNFRRKHNKSFIVIKRISGTERRVPLKICTSCGLSKSAVGFFGWTECRGEKHS